MSTSWNSYYAGRKEATDPSPRCCVAEECIQKDKGRYTILTTLRTDKYLPLLEVGTEQLAWISACHSQGCHRAMHTACTSGTARQVLHRTYQLYASPVIHCQLCDVEDFQQQFLCSLSSQQHHLLFCQVTLCFTAEQSPHQEACVA